MSMTFDELERMSNNPSRVVARIFNGIEQAHLDGGGTINSAGHPFPYALDLIVGTNYSFLSRLGDSTAKTYPIHARNLEDLSKVMSDEDWYGVYGTPASTTWRWYISEESLNRIAIPYSSVDGTLVNNYKKLVIPQDTQFYVADVPFLLENPVEIRVMEHGGYQVVYDSTVQSPFKELTTNAPDKEQLEIDGRKYLSIHLPIRQLAIKEHPSEAINATSGFRKTYTFPDQLYAIRAFITPDGSSKRSEMAVVFNDDTFDPKQPTVTIDMIDTQNFRASIPSVYLQNGLGLGRLTLLVYTTRGNFQQGVDTMRTQVLKAEYLDYQNEKGKLGTFSVPLRQANEIGHDIVDPVSGGINAVSFQELKNLIIYGHRRRQVPISNSDFYQTLSRQGYDTVKSIDFVTSRLYRTTKDLPIQQSKLFDDESVARFNSSIGTYAGTVLTSLEELVASGNAIDNGRRVTVRRRSVFDITEQTSRLTARHEIDTLLTSSNQIKIDVMGERSMVYTPFLYVIDTTKDRAAVRCYRVAKPEIRYQTFRYENAGLGMQVGVGMITISTLDDGYLLQIKTKSSDAYKELPDVLVGLQLSLNPSGGRSAATIKGKLEGKTSDNERVFSFKLGSRFDIDDIDQIDLAGFNQFGSPVTEIRVNLDEAANFIFTYGGDGQQLRSSSDFKIDQTLFDKVNVAIIETEYKISLGKALRSLYTRIRPMVGEAKYKKYAQNVPDVYAEDEFKYENNKLVIVDGKAVLLNRKGDVRMTNETPPKPIWKYTAGQTVFDENGDPVLLEPRFLKYHWDYTGFDFNYMVSQDEYDKNYCELVEDFFADEVNYQLDQFNRVSLDETRIMFKPRSTMGFTDIILNEGIEKTIRADIRLGVTYYLTDEGMSDGDLKKVLINNTHRVANEQLRKQTFSVSELISALRSTDIVDVRVVASAGQDGVDVVTNIDDTNGFSVRKLIDQTSDRLLTIREDIEIMFKRHIPRK